jgi:hypothetical protein
MAQHSELFYCLEQSIRKLSTEAMQEAAGANWREQKTPQQIRDEVKELTEAKVDSGVTRCSDRAIDCTTFGRLSVTSAKRRSG